MKRLTDHVSCGLVIALVAFPDPIVKGLVMMHGEKGTNGRTNDQRTVVTGRRREVNCLYTSLGFIVNSCANTASRLVLGRLARSCRSRQYMAKH